MWRWWDPSHDGWKRDHVEGLFGNTRANGWPGSMGTQDWVEGRMGNHARVRASAEGTRPRSRRTRHRGPGIAKERPIGVPALRNLDQVRAD
eukprot:scaffold684_cov345-Pavlova_lutheri.AAC.68